jgi:hypothetical protein
MNTQIDVALILWNPDVIQWVSLVLLDKNLKCYGIEPSDGVQKMEELIASRGPSLVIFDLDPPYQRSAAVFLRLLDRFPDRSFVITCADPSLAINVAPWLSCHLTLQKPYEPQVIGRIVTSMVEGRVRGV